MSRFKGWSIPVAVVLCVLVVAITQKPIRIAYHKREMRKVMNVYKRLDMAQIYASQMGVEFEKQKEFPYEKYHHHREELVKLGELIEMCFMLKQVSGRTKEGRHLFVLLMSKKSPPYAEMESGFSFSAHGPLTFFLWIEPKYLDDWSDFISQHDIADYSEKFMDENDRQKFSVEQQWEIEYDRRLLNLFRLPQPKFSVE